MKHNPPQQPHKPSHRDQPARRKAAPRKSLPPGQDDPELFMPTPEALERQVRRRSFGRTFAEICLDLAVVPGLCTPPFWNGMFEIMHYFGGNARTVMREKTRREQAFIRSRTTSWTAPGTGCTCNETQSASYSASSSANPRSIHSPEQLATGPP